MMNKKASMQLSINMIVILIIAVVILGLALGFIQGMFGKMSKSFEEKAASEPDPTPASSSEQLTLSRGDTIVTNPGEELTLKWSVYCTDETNDCVKTSLDNIECTSYIGGTGDTDLTEADGEIESTSEDIAFGSSSQIITLVAIPKSVAQNKYLCTATIKHGRPSVITATKDIVINVMK